LESVFKVNQPKDYCDNEFVIRKSLFPFKTIID